MRKLARTIIDWVDGGHRVAVVRVVDLTGFGAVPAGEVLAIRDDGQRAGAVLRGALDPVIAGAVPRVLGGETVEVSGPVAEDEAVALGLACAGEARLLLHPVSGDRAAWAALAEGRPAALVTGVEDGEHDVVLADQPGAAGPASA
jgi:xanthine dehydrogenase accessory factor